MTKTSKILWISGLVIFVAASIAINYQVKYVMHRPSNGLMHKMGKIEVGQHSPDFTLQDLSGQPVTLKSYQGQKVVLMDFWATWCGPCRMAMPDLQSLTEKFKNRGLEILSVNQGETAEQTREFIEKHKYAFHVVLDKDQAVGNNYGVRAIPTLVLVDKKGIVQWVSVGYSGDDNTLGQLVEKLTKE